MKHLTTTLAIMFFGTVFALAQDRTGTAVQTTKLALSNAIDITFVNNGNSTGSTVDLAFENVNDYANGVEGAPLEIKVRSNKKFIVKARTSSKTFAYSGTTSPAPSMNVQNTLFIKVLENSTGGSVPGSVNNKYATLKRGNRKLIHNGTPGGNNTFKVQYKADPGFEFPAGTYTVDVIYTATQR